jgi:hypothetical protein
MDALALFSSGKPPRHSCQDAGRKFWLFAASPAHAEFVLSVASEYNERDSFYCSISVQLVQAFHRCFHGLRSPRPELMNRSASVHFFTSNKLMSVTVYRKNSVMVW